MITRARLELDARIWRGGLEPVEVRHADVEQHDVRMQPTCVLNGF